MTGRWPSNVLLDEVSADMLGEQARFFYTGKASIADRDGSCDTLLWRRKGDTFERVSADEWKALPKAQRARGNIHPTVKPTDLMAWLVRLLAPPRAYLGVEYPLPVLDPFMGSGSTLAAAKRVGVHAIGIDLDEAHCEIAAHRCSQQVLAL